MTDRSIDRFVAKNETRRRVAFVAKPRQSNTGRVRERDSMAYGQRPLGDWLTAECWDSTSQPASTTHTLRSLLVDSHTNGNLMALFEALNKCNLNETQILQKFTRKIFCPCKFIANRMPGRSHKFILRKHHVLIGGARSALRLCSYWLWAARTT